MCTFMNLFNFVRFLIKMDGSSGVLIVGLLELASISMGCGFFLHTPTCFTEGEKLFKWFSVLIKVGFEVLALTRVDLQTFCFDKS